VSRLVSFERSLTVLLILAWAAVLASGASAAPEIRPVNINTADVEELMTLPRVGPVIAQRIVDYRKENGPFTRPAELMNVKGIGEKTFESLKDRITVGEERKK
jgi:competence protein ComEA